MPPRMASSRILLTFVFLFVLITLASAASQSFHRHSFNNHHKALDRRQDNPPPDLTASAPPADAEPTDVPEDPEEGEDESSSASSIITSSSSSTTVTSRQTSSSSSSTITTSSSTTTTSSSTTTSEEETSTTSSSSTTSSAEETTTSSSSSSKSSSSRSSSSTTASSSRSTTSSSSSVSSSSSTAVLSSPTGAPAIPTGDITNDFSPTEDEPPTDSSTAETSSNASASFWDNKGAVAGTFVSVSILALALVAFAFWRVRKRQHDKRADSVNFDRYSRAQSPDFGSGDGHHHTMADLSNEPPLSAYPNRDIHYDNIVPPPIIPIEYGNRSSYLAYPPGAVPYGEPGHVPTYGQEGAAHQNPFGSASQQWNSGALYGESNGAQGYHTTDQSNNNAYPSQTAPARRRSTNPFHDSNAVERGSYQPSVDSFYGGNAQQAGREHPYAGYAS
ncbi:hypothetical protein BDV98DRAFT_569196 [Pterulicium gracile]|uniref:REJ domain-containing protein n=1 Tax=Pterulicium gracile TaxID=1884261 RepID=A0A5C3QJY2_9AGAR|nr:hypothetical protein BDV98DRAFT_569196 [Pterula gracilis]